MKKQRTPAQLIQKALHRLSKLVRICRICGQPFLPSGRQVRCYECQSLNRYQRRKKEGRAV